MKKNLDFCIVLFICLLICGSLYVLYDHTNEYSVANSNKVVASRGKKAKSRSYNLFSHSNPVSGAGVEAVQSSNALNNRGRSSSRVSHVSVPQGVRPHNQVQSSSSSLPLISSASTISSNSASVSVFDGRSKGSVKLGSSIMAKSSYSQPLVYVEISTPRVYSGGVSHNISFSTTQRSLLELSSSSYVGSGDAVVRQAARKSTVSSPTLGVSSAYASVTHGFSICGNVTPIGNVAIASQHVNVQHRAPSKGLGGTWGNWLDKNWNSDDFGGTIVEDDVWFTEDEAKGIYNTMFGEDSGYWNGGMGNPPTLDDFLNWLRNNNEGKYHMPLGDTLPLVLIGLAYMLVVFVFKRK